MRALVVHVFVALALGACGSRAALPSTPTIEDLRAHAAQNPRDPDAQRELALAELLMEGGDAARVEAQVARALALAPDDERLLFAAALERNLHGYPGEALARYLDAVEAAQRSPRTGASYVAESALVAVDELADAAPRWSETVRPRLETLARDPGHLGAAARYRIAETLVELAFRRGDTDAVARIGADAGCISEWRVAGPFGPRTLLDFDGDFAVAPGRPLEDRYDLGPGRGTRDTRTYGTRGCSVHLGGGPVSAGGTTFAQGVVTVERGGPQVLRLETPNAAKLFVDGRLVARLDMRVEPTPRVTFHRVELDPGRHVVTVQIATGHPNPVLVGSLLPAPDVPGRPEADGPFASYLAATVAMSRGDTVAAREALRHHTADDDASSAVLQLRGGIALGDPHRPGDMSRDEARRLLRVAARRDPESWYPPVQLARLDAADGRALQAIERLREAAARWPEIVAVPLSLTDLYLGRGWYGQAERQIARAREIAPGACRPIRGALSQAERRSQTAEMERLARQLVACDARTSALYEQLLRRRDWDGASEELDRLATFEPPQSRHGILVGRLEIARGRGEEAIIDRLLAEIAADQPQSVLTPIARADRQLARGEPEQAARVLAEAVAAEPTALAELRLSRRSITGDFDLTPYRLDGAEVLRELEASGRTYEEPEVLVLDYTVVRLFEDGSTLELTHNIWRVQSEEALDERGELRLPEGARILKLHTIKGDTGRRIEPDAIEGKDTISLPNLAPGDYVEYEYVRLGEPPAGFPGGYLGDRFFFRSFETPFDRSELVLVLPPSVEPVIDPRGPAPETERREGPGGVQVLRWSVRESRPLVPEPMSVAPREYIPSVNVGVNATWERFVDSLLDALADRDVHDPAARRLAERVVGEAIDGSDEAKARRLYAWVLANIEESNDAFGLAPAMLFDRTGNRARVLRYMLGLVGVQSKLVLARSAAADANRPLLPDGETYEHLLVALGDGRFLSTAERGAPFSYVPPLLRGQEAVVLDRGAPRVRIPAGADDADRREVEVDAHLRDDGSAVVEVVETFHGANAIGWRNDLEGVPDATLESRFGEAYVARLVPGAEMTRLRIVGREDPERPLVLEYAFEVRSLGRRQGERWIVPGLFPTHLAPTYAGLGQRTTTQLVAPPIDVEARVTVHLPASVSVPEPPRAVELSGPNGARFRMEGEREGQAFTLRRSVRLPVMRVAPTEYAVFARFCRAVDQAEARETAIDL